MGETSQIAAAVMVQLQLKCCCLALHNVPTAQLFPGQQLLAAEN